MYTVIAFLIIPIVSVLCRRRRNDDAPLDAAALETLRKRAEAHAAACAGLENDPLVKAWFGKPEALKPMETPFRAGGMLARQAD